MEHRFRLQGEIKATLTRVVNFTAVRAPNHGFARKLAQAHGFCIRCISTGCLRSATVISRRGITRMPVDPIQSDREVSNADEARDAGGANSPSALAGAGRRCAAP